MAKFKKSLVKEFEQYILEECTITLVVGVPLLTLDILKQNPSAYASAIRDYAEICQMLYEE